VETILKQALLDHKRVSIRGTQHSMGGHSLCRDAIVMDTKYLAHMEYNNNNNNDDDADDGNNGGTTSSSPTVTVGAGCRWSDVIRFLNPYSKSPATMQSYCSFSVGGTVAVNAHGITTDTPLAADVVAFRLVRYVWDENEQQQQVKVETIVCQPPPIMGSTDEKTSTKIRIGILIMLTMMTTLLMMRILLLVILYESGKHASCHLVVSKSNWLG
jgi:hypothetical protein